MQAHVYILQLHVQICAEMLHNYNPTEITTNNEIRLTASQVVHYQQRKDTEHCSLDQVLCLMSLQASCCVFYVMHQRRKIFSEYNLHCKYCMAKIFHGPRSSLIDCVQAKMSLGKPHPLPVAQSSEVMASNFGSWLKKAFRILLLARCVLVTDSLITALNSRSSLPLSNVASSYNILNSHFPIT